MAIQKVYRKSVDRIDADGKKVLNNAGKCKQDVTYHATFETVTKTVRGAEREYNVGTGPAIMSKEDPSKNCPVVVLERGVYANVDSMSDLELFNHKSVTNVRRLIQPEFEKVLTAIDVMVKRLEGNGILVNNAVRDAIVTHCAARFDRLDTALINSVTKYENPTARIRKAKVEMPALPVSAKS
jgi:hypothetical protein